MNNGNIVVNTDSRYVKFCRVREALRAANMGNPDKYIIAEKTLRVEQLLSTTKSRYDFNLYETPDAGRAQEVKLSRNDLFFISHIGVFVYKQDAAADPPQYGNTQLFTYPDPNFFPGAVGGAAPFEWQCLYLVWRGKLALYTDPVQRIKDFSTEQCMYVPERTYIQSAFVGITSDIFPQWGGSFSERGFYEMAAMPALYGQQTNRISLELGAGDQSVLDGAVDAAGEAVDTRNVLAVHLHGFNVENGGVAQGMWDYL